MNSKILTFLRWSLLGRLVRKFVGRGHGPPPGHLDFGSFRTTRPISQDFGFDRGLPIDRYYIERFLALHAEDIRGDVLEVKDNIYTKRFGADRVRNSQVVVISRFEEGATIVADLARADHIPSSSFDCIILTQTLQFIYSLSSTVDTLHRILKPGGILLVTVPGISTIAVDPLGAWADQWRMTKASCKTLFQEYFSANNVEIQTFGNVLTAIAFLEGLATHELTESELSYRDPAYEVLVAVRAVK